MEQREQKAYMLMKTLCGIMAMHDPESQKAIKDAMSTVASQSILEIEVKND